MITKLKTATAKVKHFKFKLTLAVILILGCTATTVFAAASAVTTLVYCEDEIMKVISFSAEPQDIIERAGIQQAQECKVNLSSFDPEAETSVIYVYKPHRIVIDDDGKKTELVAAGTVADALKKAKIKLNDADHLSVNKKVFLKEGMTITISRSFSVLLKADGKTRECALVKGTVEDLLDKTGVTLGKHDTTSYPLDKLLTAGMKIVVKRVSFKNRVAKEKIKYTTKTLYSDSMFSDQQTVNTEGVNGLKRVTYLDKYVDGKRVKSTPVTTKVLEKPVERVVTVGTRERYISDGRPVSSSRIISVLDPPFSIKLDKNGRPLNYKRVITGKATAYCTGSITSTGVSPLPGRVAVNPNQIPYGTKMYIVSRDGRYLYGYAVAADTGGFTWNGSGTLIDLYMYSYSDCMAFGRRDVEVYILS